MPEPVAADELDAAARYILVEVVEDAPPLWELAALAHTQHTGSETRIVGLGDDIEDASERLRVAQRAALALLARGLVEVETGPDWVEEGKTVAGDAAERALQDNMSWAWPLHPPRETFVWLVPTPAGKAAAQRIPPDCGRVLTPRRSRVVKRLRGTLARLRA